jgi:hypothetical protein
LPELLSLSLKQLRRLQRGVFPGYLVFHHLAKHITLTFFLAIDAGTKTESFEKTAISLCVGSTSSTWFSHHPAMW